MRTALPLRNNPAVWFSPVVTSGIIYMWLTVQSPIVPDPYWTAYLARAGDGLQYGLPFAAAGAAWAAWRQRRFAEAAPGSLRGSARIYWAHLWPLFAAVVVGLGVCVVAQAARQMPTASEPHLGLLVVFAAMTVVATGIGWLAGTLLPLALALPVALFLAFEWAVYPLSDGGNVSYRNMTGYALFGCCDSASYEPTPRALVSPVVVMLGVLIAVLVAIRHHGRVRWILAAAPALATAVVVANVVAAGTGPYGEQLRDGAAEDCAGREPTVCVFPEAGSARARTLMHNTISDAYRDARAAGLTLPPRVMMTSRYPVNRTGVTFVNLASTFGRQEIVQAYSDGIYSSLQCTKEVPPDARLLPGTDVQFALGVALGLDVETATPQISIGGEEGAAAGRELSPAEIRQLLGVTNHEAAVDVARRWLERQYACARGNGSQ